MNSNEIINELKKMSDEKYKKNIIKLGIPEDRCIGVPMADLRKFSKNIKKDNDLARELWISGYHEAMLLSVLIMDKKSVTLEYIEEIMNDVISWDLCDHLCKNIIIKIKGYEDLIYKWSSSEKLYYKRAAFTLIASYVIHNKKADDEALNKMLQIIEENSDDDREHVKKAVLWALKEIGKKDMEWKDKSAKVSNKLILSGIKSKVWIGNNALKELNTLVKVEGRTRLISNKSKMGSNV
ncbi:DNA alkylation repair enzyme [Anaerofustis stercorihominis DSM 17244]|uniref:DNA alkylation repair enzyme n=1 Tax=Anaerofustis stercorihominis DSM 17244 TaxID=445971 RepID=B1CBN8_9FIRM|nr:DNA alkylation repair protein [Anaerofustis stercorihominis]EDS71685.1 DNA alkylation repair enzyme [Anaerofustis stercorihominis DSM 17244]